MNQLTRIEAPAAGPLLSGRWVEVKSPAEIAATLDDDGRLDGLPFMPEMTAFCGRRMRVYRRADKTCVEGFGLRRLTSAVLLEEARCDGAAHDGCQRGCMMFWKEAWLRPVEAPERRRAPRSVSGPQSERLWSIPSRKDDLYSCQSTELSNATGALSKWNVTHLATDVRRGELGVGRFLQILTLTVVNRVRRQLGKPEMWVLTGEAKAAKRGRLDLAPGEWVRVKPAEAIRETLDATGRNLGLSFEPEMSRYIGGVYQVDQRVERIIHEETGRMTRLRNTVILRNLVCQGLCVKNCPRSNPLYWREAWLERVDAPAASAPRT
ncbi:MAG TPA: hypothetical protein VIO94_03810 [Phenylobacterium sp.]